MFRKYRIEKKQPEAMESIMKLFVAKNGLATGMNIQLVFAAWDKISGADRYTVRKFFKDGILYCTISSSVIRNQLYFQKDTLLQLLNAELEKDKLYDTGKGLVKNIVLK